MPVPLALPTPLIAALRALKVGVPFLQGCHTLTVWLRALHQAPIPAADMRSLLHCQHADPSHMPSLPCKHAFDQGHLKKSCTAYAAKRVTMAQHLLLDKCVFAQARPSITKHSSVNDTCAQQPSSSCSGILPLPHESTAYAHPHPSCLAAHEGFGVPSWTHLLTVGGC